MKTDLSGTTLFSSRSLLEHHGEMPRKVFSLLHHYSASILKSRAQHLHNNMLLSCKITSLLGDGPYMVHIWSSLVSHGLHCTRQWTGLQVDTKMQMSLCGQISKPPLQLAELLQWCPCSPRLAHFPSSMSRALLMP